MRRRLSMATCVSVAALGVAPAAAGACPSLAGVNSFRGHASVTFSAHNSGPDVGNGGSYSANLKRSLASIAITLNHKKVIRNRFTGTTAIFTGKARGGTVMVNDDFDDSGAMFSGQETYSGPLSNQRPGFGSATVFLDLNTCHYKATVSFGVKTSFTGTLESGSHPMVTGTAYGERERLPRNLHLVGGAGPDAYGGACPGGNPILSPLSCYRYGGGLIGLCGTFDVSTPDCPADPVGDAHFIWVLMPSTKKT